MGRRSALAICLVIGAFALVAACTPDTGGGGGPTTTTTTTTTIPPNDPNGRYVTATGTDTGDCATLATACATVQFATDQAVAGNTVYVGAGTYPEMVSVDKALVYQGANAGQSAGASPEARGPESIVKGFRNPGNPGTTSIDVTINGFQIDPQGDAALISATAQPLVWLRGGTAGVDVSNNVFNGGPYDGACSYTCTTMTDYAFTVQSGIVTFADNGVTNFRRPVNINQPVGAPVTNAVVSGNSFTGITSRAVSLAGSTGVQMGGQAVTGNVFDATGRTTSTPAGITVSNHANTISGNTFTGFSSGVYVDLCKKFSTDDNHIVSNTFTNNSAGINISVNTDGGQCSSSTTEGTGGWVMGGGRINGLKINDNNFNGNTTYAVRHAAYNWQYWSPSGTPVSAGPIDATCNYWNSASGPTVDVHVLYTDPLVPVADQLVYADAPHPVFTYSPWRTAAAPGGACDGV